MIADLLTRRAVDRVGAAAGLDLPVDLARHRRRQVLRIGKQENNCRDRAPPWAHQVGGR